MVGVLGLASVGTSGCGLLPKKETQSPVLETTLALSVNRVEETKRLGSLLAEGRFVMVWVDVTNNTQKELLLNPSQLSLTHRVTGQVSPLAPNMSAAVGAALGEAEGKKTLEVEITLPVGETGHYLAVFQVPEEANLTQYDIGAPWMPGSVPLTQTPPVVTVPHEGDASTRVVPALTTLTPVAKGVTAEGYRLNAPDASQEPKPEGPQIDEPQDAGVGME